MDLHKLFNIGVSFRTFLLNQSREERARLMKLYIPMNIKEELKERIDRINNKVLILGIVEGSCTECHMTLAVLEKLVSTNKNIILRIIMKKDALDSLNADEEAGTLKVPAFIFMNENYQQKASLCGKSDEVISLVKTTDKASILMNAIALQLVEGIEKIG